MAFTLTSLAFKKEGDLIPKKHTCEGPDLSPPLRWTNGPKGTKSFALIADDPDAPVGTWVHWVIFKLPGETTELTEGLTAHESLSNVARQCRNDFRSVGYG